MDPDIAAAIAQISQGPNGQVRVRLHDKHAALVSGCSPTMCRSGCVRHFRQADECWGVEEAI